MSALMGVLAITDEGWFENLRDQPAREEVNFWRPSARRGINADAFTPFLFKLEAPHNAVCGFGYFVRFARLPPWLAWEAFGAGNGSASFDEMQNRIRTVRLRIGYEPPPGPDEIGCALIAEPVFFPKERWVRQPSDWPARTLSDERYDLSVGQGARGPGALPPGAGGRRGPGLVSRRRRPPGGDAPADDRGRAHLTKEGAVGEKENPGRSFPEALNAEGGRWPA